MQNQKCKELWFWDSGVCFNLAFCRYAFNSVAFSEYNRSKNDGCCVSSREADESHFKLAYAELSSWLSAGVDSQGLNS